MDSAPHPTPRDRRNLSRFCLKAFLWTSPLLLLLALDNFILPRGSFCFRCWEALAVHQDFSRLPGPFYPGKSIERLEIGDEGVGTKYAVKRKVDWHTDDRGYRNRRPQTNSAEVVIVGDSMAVGSGLPQADILGEVIERTTGLRTYTFAPSPLGGAIRKMDRQFTAMPRVLIWEVLERYVELLEPADVDFLKKIPRFRPPPPRSPVADDFFVRFDHFKKLTALRTVRGTVDRAAGVAVASLLMKAGPESKSIARLNMITDEKITNAQASDEVVERCAQTVASYLPFLEARGIRFVFLPLPNKENIYWEFLTTPVEPTFLPRLIKRVRELGVTVIDVQSAMQAARQSDPSTLLYQLDDTHWSAAGVGVTTGELQKYFRSLPEGAMTPGPDRTRDKAIK